MPTTIQVYTLNVATGERTVKVREHKVPEPKTPIWISAWPPCECPRCCPKRRP